MLLFLKVKDFALIEEAEMEFGEGLNVITGETGAGKSILANALFSFLSPRIKEGIVREGAEKAEVTGQFWLGDGEYILRRVMSPHGRSRAFLNEEPVTLAKMEEFARGLISFCSQNEYQELLDKSKYVFLLDSILSLNSERERLKERVETDKILLKEMEEKRSALRGRERELALLEFQVREIEREMPKENEEEGIRERIRMLKQSERIKRVLRDLRDILYETEGASVGRLKRLLSEVRSVEGVESMEGLGRALESLIVGMEELYAEARELERHLSFDPEELSRLEDRLSRIYDLKAKYGKSLEEIREYVRNAKERMDMLRNLSTNLEEMERERECLAGQIREISENLTRKRREGAERLCKEITSELWNLAMKEAEFMILIEDKGFVDQTGKDDVDFLIRTNVGESFRPLRRIASGGELSRIMLALKKIMGGEEGKTLVFDEVDQGIGGRVADVVGRRLRELTSKYQIICITHLPQIAAYGSRHFLVEKVVEAERTKTKITRLDEEERVREIARMIGGECITPRSIDRAREMLEHAQKSAS